MKTLKDLVDELNEKFTPGYVNHFFEFEDDEVCRCFILYCSRPMVEFDKKHKTYSLLPAISNVKYEYQKLIVEYLANADKTDWFPEKKYYIAIGQFDEDSKALYYKKTDGTGFSLLSKCDFNGKNLHDNIIFTEKEIEELKATLSEKMAKIVDFGKVEVKDD